MRARLINEKFEEAGDPVHNMGIGEVEYSKLQKIYKQLEEFMQFDMEDIDFSRVIETLDYLRRINAYSVSSFFNRKYNFNIRIIPENSMGEAFAAGTMGNYKIVFSTTGPGKMILVKIADKNGHALNIGNPFMRDAGKSWAHLDNHKTEGASRTLHGLHDKFL